MIRITRDKNFRLNLAKQLPFAAASALTATANAAQGAVLGSLGHDFTLRNQWYQPSNKFGIKIKPARKTDLRAEIGTNADWVEKFETGRDKTPRGDFLAVPTVSVRRTKRDIIRRNQRPKALRGKRSFVLQTKSGPVLFQRRYKGKRSQIVALYNLERRARIKKLEPVTRPAQISVRRNLQRNFAAAFSDALRTAR